MLGLLLLALLLPGLLLVFGVVVYLLMYWDHDEQDQRGFEVLRSGGVKDVLGDVEGDQPRQL